MVNATASVRVGNCDGDNDDESKWRWRAAEYQYRYDDGVSDRVSLGR